jgi:hypothetical protein
MERSWSLAVANLSPNVAGRAEADTHDARAKAS